jgi:hypothetical protein
MSDARKAKRHRTTPHAEKHLISSSNAVCSSIAIASCVAFRHICQAGATE